MALKQIKNQIAATKKTGQVTKAMESVSAVKMRKSQERAFTGRPYIRAALRILSRVANTADGLAHPLAQTTVGTKTLAVIVTSDKGLAGSVNSAVLKKVHELMQEVSGEVEAICIGRKAVDAMRREGVTVLGEYQNLSDDITLEEVTEVANTLVNAYQTEHYAKVVVVYQNFLSTFEQEPTVRQVLPVDPAELHYMRQGIVPSRGHYSEQTEAPDEPTDYKVEPNTQEVLNALIPQLVQIMVYHAILESKACEHSARMVAMKNATDKSKEVAKALTLVFNKQRQAAITAEVSEITGGIEAMK
ncbi:MAG TPA: ATP synthase F1 subunit gamma [Candidatus Paceibacterota bacterium]|nr:ATP synthase F1 subunit gamma [Candidatus Paceibacterota bacterium]